ncbi:hypothetical protein ABZ863_23995 [Saccharomonospora sp. NPDC046836]|uniref:hypothetical protein n=1 Tax=Saccharomonospora sp. NPDC046836 TaxID=3156921 RepID=UPI0034076F05
MIGLVGDSLLGRQLPDRILALNRLKMWVDASLHRAINSLDENRGHASDVAAELALLLSVGEQHARRVVDLSTTLVHRLPETLAAMESGVVDSYRASKVAAATAWLDDSQARQVDSAVGASA